MTTTGVIDPSEFKNYKSISNLTYYYRSNEVETALFLRTLLDPTESIYVGFSNSSRVRYGSIGRIRFGKYDKDRSTWPPIPRLNLDRAYEYLYDLAVEFDDGHSIKNVDVWSEGLVWLKNYSGPTNWIFTKKAAEPVVAVDVFDRLGNQLAVGDFVAFVGRQPYTTGMGDLYFGAITKISAKGTVYVKNIKLSDDDVSKEMRLTQPERATKLDKDILNTLILKKLTF